MASVRCAVVTNLHGTCTANQQPRHACPPLGSISRSHRLIGLPARLRQPHPGPPLPPQPCLQNSHNGRNGAAHLAEQSGREQTSASNSTAACRLPCFLAIIKRPVRPLTRASWPARLVGVGFVLAAPQKAANVCSDPAGDEQKKAGGQVLTKQQTAHSVAANVPCGVHTQRVDGSSIGWPMPNPPEIHSDVGQLVGGGSEVAGQRGDVELPRLQGAVGDGAAACTGMLGKRACTALLDVPALCSITCPVFHSPDTRPGCGPPWRPSRCRWALQSMWGWFRGFSSAPHRYKQRVTACIEPVNCTAGGSSAA